MKHLITLIFALISTMTFSQTEKTVEAENLKMPVGVSWGPGGA